MTYNEYKQAIIDLIRASRIEAAVDLDEQHPEFSERWENEPLPADTWMTI